MAEYIEREMALKAIDEYFHTTNPDGEEQIGVLKSRKVIRALPAADVEVVKRGRWESVQDKPFMIYACSQCGEKFGYGMVLHCHYCPNCGAKMEVDNER